MSIGTGLLAVIGGGMLAAGLSEARAHSRALEAIPLRVHVNGTRGKSSVTKAVTTLFRELGKTAVGKVTGTLPVIIGADGAERLIRRRGRTRIQEQVRFLRYAAAQEADVAVVECMAVDPTLQWICEHRFVRSHIGVITNVRRDHFEEMGRTLEEIARCLANTIPRHGVLVTADARFAPLFAEIAAPLGTRVVSVDDEEVRKAAAMLRKREHEQARAQATASRNDDGTRPHDVLNAMDDALLEMHAENVAIACRVAVLAGFPEAAVRRAAGVLSRPRLHVTTLGRQALVASGRGEPGAASRPEQKPEQEREQKPEQEREQEPDQKPEQKRCVDGNVWRIPTEPGRFLVHAWSMNDTDSFSRLLAAALSDSAPSSVVALYNHRSDRPLRAIEFGRLLAATPSIVGVLVTGDPGGQRLLRRAGVPAERLRTVPTPITTDAVETAVEAFVRGGDADGPLIVFGCGNARGVEALELGGELPAVAGSWV